MLLRLLRDRLTEGNGTLAYPRQAEAAPKSYRGQVMIDVTRCSGEAECMRVCPAQAIAVERDGQDWQWRLDDARCVFCGLCAETCPSGALRLSNEFELATRRAGDLLVSVQFVEQG